LLNVQYPCSPIYNCLTAHIEQYILAVIAEQLSEVFRHRSPTDYLLRMCNTDEEDVLVDAVVGSTKLITLTTITTKNNFLI
jgi:hypothetical protein